MTDSVRVSVTVPADPGTAFRVFTDEIDDWYVRGPYSWVNPELAAGIRFEDGYLREVWKDGGHVDTGRVLAWEPPHRVLWADLLNDGAMEIEVEFRAVTGGTEVVLVHRGLDTLPPDVAGRIRRGYAWQIGLRWYAENGRFGSLG